MASLCRASSMNRSASSGMGPSRSPSLPILDAFPAPSSAACVRPGAGPAAPSLRRNRPGVGAQHLERARTVVVHATDKGALAALRDDVARFVARYDPVATGLGSLSLCGYCMVVHGQSAAEALQMSALATVLGMVANELLFSDGDNDSSTPSA